MTEMTPRKGESEAIQVDPEIRISLEMGTMTEVPLEKNTIKVKDQGIGSDGE